MRHDVANVQPLDVFSPAKCAVSRLVWSPTSIPSRTIGNSVVDFGAGNFLFAQCVREDSPTNNNCAVIGGTGRFSGARGSAVEDSIHGVEDKKNRTFTYTVTVTFLP